MTTRYDRALIAALVLLAAALPAAAQQEEGRIVFTDPKSRNERILSDEDLQPRNHAGGMDLMVGNDGFGLGFFYHRVLSDVVTAFANVSFSETKDIRQVDYYDYWGNTWSPNKLNNVFRVPIFFGIQYRLFKDDIVDNFRPFINGGAGPVMLYVTPADRDWFTALGYGHTKWTYGGFAGVGAQFGFDRASVVGMNIRYMFIPLPAGIQSVAQGSLQNANGFFITLNIGFSF